jgi:FkbM family methyltransferase
MAGTLKDALRGLIRDPRSVLGFAARLGRSNPAAMGMYLAARFPEERRAIGACLIRNDVHAIDFTYGGVRWLVDLGDEVGFQVFTRGAYEGPQTSAVIEWLEDRPGVVIDVGANIGTTTLQFAFAGRDVIAVEPIPSNFELLTTNVSRNGLNERVRCVNQAIARERGELKMWTGFGSGQGEVAVETKDPAVLRWGDRGTQVSVPAGPLPDVIGSEDVALVWADVQGSEGAVIETGAALWRHGVPLYAEIDPYALELHGGLSRFLVLTQDTFTHFWHRTPKGAPAAISLLEDMVRSMGPTDYTNLLFVRE